MHNHTRKKFNAYLHRVAELNGVTDATEKFAADPVPEQALETKIQESAGFLQRISIIGVDNQQGEKVGIDIGGPVASTTDTTAQERQTTDPTSMDKVGYLCTQTNFDTHLTYAKLDAWRHFPDFQPRINNLIAGQQARDRLIIGFNGVSRAVTSDKVANPLLQDVNIGWLQKLRDHKPANVLTEGGTAGEVRVGAGGDYANIDALVFDAINELLDPWYREDAALRAIVGREILTDKYLPLIEQWEQPTENNALQSIILGKKLGGQVSERVPFMPPRAVFITMPKNLSIYWQRGTRRRHIMDNPKRDRVEDYQSVNEAYVIEDFGAACLIENIKYPDGQGGWA